MSNGWYGLVDPTTGELKSVGTDAMIGPETPAEWDVHDFGERPDFGTHVWNPATRALDPRPEPVMKDRLDDIEGWLMSDPDFAQAWSTMNQSERSAVRTGFRRVLARVAGGRRMRHEDEPAELD